MSRALMTGCSMRAIWMRKVTRRARQVVAGKKSCERTHVTIHEAKGQMK
jgi:hypothetical protein